MTKHWTGSISTARTVSPHFAFATLALAISMLASMTGGSFAGTIRLGGYSPGELNKECADNGGTFKAQGDAYQCKGKGGTVVCTGDGTKKNATCTGSCPKCGTSAAKSTGISGILHPSSNTPTKGKQ